MNKKHILLLAGIVAHHAHIVCMEPKQQKGPSFQTQSSLILRSDELWGKQSDFSLRGVLKGHTPYHFHSTKAAIAQNNYSHTTINHLSDPEDFFMCYYERFPHHRGNFFFNVLDEDKRTVVMKEYIERREREIIGPDDLLESLIPLYSSSYQ